MNKRRKENRYRPRPREVTLPSPDFMGNLEVGLKVIMIVIAVALTTLFFIFVENAVTQCRSFSLKQISISGNLGLSRSEVIEKAGLRMEGNIIAVNLDTLRQRLISHPWIQDAAVKRVMPSEIKISIREQKALAVVRLDDMADILINSKGEPFNENDGIGNNVYAAPDARSLMQLNGNGRITPAARDHESHKSIFTVNNVVSDSRAGTGKKPHTLTGDIYGAAGNGQSGGNPVLNIPVKHPLPVITGLKLAMGPDNRCHFSGRLHESIMELLHMKKKEVIQQISADHETGIEINTIIHQNPFSLQSDEQPVKIKLGFDNFKEKFKKIRHITKYMQENNFNKQICSIDLINPENIVIQIKNGDALPESQQGGV